MKSLLKLIVAVWTLLRSTVVLELAAAVLIVAGVADGWGRPQALIVAGVMLALKVFERESAGGGG